MRWAESPANKLCSITAASGAHWLVRPALDPAGTLAGFAPEAAREPVGGMAGFGSDGLAEPMGGMAGFDAGTIGCK
jgi:hypothetical protein